MAHKQSRGFNTTDVPLELVYLHAEVSEVFEAYRDADLAKVRGELADVAIFALSLAEMFDVDLGAAVEDKMRRNAARTYVRSATGLPVQVAGDAPSSANRPDQESI